MPHSQMSLTLYILMDFLINIDTINMGLSIVYICTLRVVFLSLLVVFILGNSVDPDEMQHYAAFHLGLHCLPKYPFRGFQYTRGYPELRRLLL